MQPWAHSFITARGSGRDWTDDLPIHEFLDSTKACCPDLRHRLVLHNSDLGPALAQWAFPGHPDAAGVAAGHVRQDLKAVPALADWLRLCDVERFPRRRRGRGDGRAIVGEAADYLMLEDRSPVERVWELLTLPSRLAPDFGEAADLVLMNAAGPVLARRIFGPPRAVARRGGGTAMFDPSWVCEGMIQAVLGRLPSLDEILRHSPWKAPS